MLVNYLHKILIHLTHALGLAAASFFLSFAVVAFMLAVKPQTVMATPGQVPFGGMILAFVPPIPFPTCPAHTLIVNYVTGFALGIYVVPGSQIYPYQNLVRPGAFVKGEYAPIPFPTCPTPYPVVPIFMVGTTL